MNMLNQNFETLYALIEGAKAIYCDGNISNCWSLEDKEEIAEAVADDENPVVFSVYAAEHFDAGYTQIEYHFDYSDFCNAEIGETSFKLNDGGRMVEIEILAPVKITNGKCEAKIVFGERPSILDEFSFDTEAELLAFYRGLEAMNGWNDYRHIEDLEADDYEHMRDEVPELYEEVCSITGMKLCNDCCGLFHKTEFDDEGLCPDCQESWYLNKYKCVCGCEWEDEHSCMCNDRCPECNKEIEPYESIELEGGAE